MYFMESIQFETKLTSSFEIKIPDNFKSKLDINKPVRIIVIPEEEKLYEDWEDDEWNKLGMILNDDLLR